MTKIIENNFDPNKDYGVKEEDELGKIVCPICNSKVYIENDDITDRGGGSNGIYGPGHRSWYYKMFRCPACKYKSNGLDAKHWDKDEDGTLYVVEDRQAQIRQQLFEKKREKYRQELVSKGKSPQEIERELLFFNIDNRIR